MLLKLAVAALVTGCCLCVGSSDALLAVAQSMAISLVTWALSTPFALLVAGGKVYMMLLLAFMVSGLWEECACVQKRQSSNNSKTDGDELLSLVGLANTAARRQQGHRNV